MTDKAEAKAKMGDKVDVEQSGVIDEVAKEAHTNWHSLDKEECETRSVPRSCFTFFFETWARDHSFDQGLVFVLKNKNIEI